MFLYEAEARYWLSFVLFFTVFMFKKMTKENRPRCLKMTKENRPKCLLVRDISYFADLFFNIMLLVVFGKLFGGL